jgi:ankyrin repeat protein
MYYDWIWVTNYSYDYYFWIDYVCAIIQILIGIDNQLMAACETNAEACVALLLEARAEHRARDANGATALRYAAVANAVASLVALLDRGAVVAARDFDGRTALMAASRAGAVECVAVLLAAGADAAREDDDDVDARSYACTSVEKWERSAAECVARQFRVKPSGDGRASCPCGGWSGQRRDQCGPLCTDQ